MINKTEIPPNSLIRLPPHDLEAEQAVLGSMIMDNEAVLTALNLLEPGDFYYAYNSKIYEVMKKMKEKEVKIDLITLKAGLDEAKCLEEVGGIRHIANLASGVPTSAHIKQYSKIVQELSFRRQCLKKAEIIKSKAYDGEYTSLIETLKNTSDVNLKTDGIEALEDVLEKALNKVYKNIKSGNSFTGVPTGFTNIDFALGGLQDSEFIVIAARPSMGKTAFSLDILRKASKAIKPKLALFFSLEMSSESLSKRLMSAELKIENEKFRFGTFKNKDYEKLKRCTPEFLNMVDNIKIDSSSDATIQDMYSKCYTEKNNSGKEIGLIIIDYIQLMTTTTKYNNRNNEISDISRNLKKMAKDFNCPVVGLSQLNRSNELRSNKRPMLSDLRDSGAIEQDADVVILLHREEYYNPTPENMGQAEAIIAKHREGGTGIIKLAFLKEIASFRNIER